MNRRVRLVILAVALLATGAQPVRAAEKLRVVATFSVIGDIAANVGGDRIDLATLVGPDGDSELHQPTAADAATVAGAELLLMNGINDAFEPWLDKLMRQAKNSVCLKYDGGCADDLNTQFFGRFRVDSMTLAGEELCWTENYANARDVVCQSVITSAERFVARSQPVATAPIAVGGELLWVDYGTSAATQDGQVMRKSLSAPSATAPTVIASMRPGPGSVAVAPGHFVWAETGVDAGAVIAQPMDGGALISIASGQRAPASVIACGGALYWVNYSANTIMRGALTAGSGVPIVTNQKSPFSIVCDATTLYWLNSGVSANGADGELWQGKLDGSEAAVMVRGISLAWALTIDDDYVYYIAQGTVTRLEGAIWRIRKHR